MPTQTVLPSFWDRLRDTDAERRTTRRTLSVHEFEASVRSDVEALLNERHVRLEGTSGSLQNTILGYGLPELIGFDVKSEVGITNVALAIQETLRVFEPRLENVTVALADDRRRLTFRVRADLRVQPGTEPVQFQAILEPGTSALRVERLDRLGHDE